MQKRRKLGLIFIVCGAVTIAIMFIPFISVHHGPSGFLRISGGEAAVVVWKTYSPMNFVYMLLSSSYSLAPFQYAFVGVVCFVALCATITLIVLGIIFMVSKKSTKQKSANVE